MDALESVSVPHVDGSELMHWVGLPFRSLHLTVTAILTDGWILQRTL
jgi:hypothetical protein